MLYHRRKFENKHPYSEEEFSKYSTQDAYILQYYFDFNSSGSTPLEKRFPDH